MLQNWSLTLRGEILHIYTFVEKALVLNVLHYWGLLITSEEFNCLKVYIVNLTCHFRKKKKKGNPLYFLFTL